MSNENISSAEMTAYWRSAYPEISKDAVSAMMASQDGIKKAHDFEEKYNYPKVSRHVSVRARFCLDQAKDNLLNHDYDSCISLGSGFSLLTYVIAADVSKAKQDIRYVDVDLPDMIRLRNERISKISEGALDPKVLQKIQTVACDLEVACQAGKKFNELFPQCQTPIFIIEGIIYFLSKTCVDWIFSQIASYEHAAVVFDYWPDDGPNNSKCFKRVVDSLQGFIPENIKGLLSYKELARLCRGRLLKDIGLQEAEVDYVKQLGIPAILNDKDEIILAKFAFASERFS